MARLYRYRRTSLILGFAAIVIGCPAAAAQFGNEQPNGSLPSAIPNRFEQQRRDYRQRNQPYQQPFQQPSRERYDPVRRNMPSSSPTYVPARPGEFDPGAVGGQRNPYGQSPSYQPGRSNDPTAGRGNWPSGLRNPLYQGGNQPSYGGSIHFGPASRHRVYTEPFGQPTGQWRQAQSMVREGNLTRAQSMIDQQLAADRSLRSHMSAISVLEQANASDSVISGYRGRAIEVARQQAHANPNDSLPWVAIARFSLEENDDTQFRQATHTLVEQFPDDKYASYFSGIQALKNEDWQTAEAKLREARARGIPEEGVAHWLRMAIDQQRWIWQYALITFYVLAAWLAGLVVLSIVGRSLSSLILRATKRANVAGVGASQRVLRSCYRLVINLAGLYYFVSLPMVLLFSIALPLSIGYALLMVPVLNLWLVALVLFVGLGSVLTAVSGLRACLVKMERNIPGKRLEKTSHARLWALTREVAEKVGTRPIDEIYILPSVDIAVVEQGSFWQRWRDNGQRTLILGFGMLDGLSEDALRGILAHEYGHFLNRDTAGGDVAFRVKASMMAFADAIIARGKIRSYDVAVQFLRFYWNMFDRLTFGASRLQEIVADRVSVHAYGPTAFKEGLRHAIRRAVEFNYSLTKHVNGIVRHEPAPASFYRPASRPNILARKAIEATIQEEFNRATTLDDSHPSPRERMRYSYLFGAPDPSPSERTAWALFDDAHALADEMNQELGAALKEEASISEAVAKVRVQQVNGLFGQHPDPLIYETRAEVYLDHGDFDRAIDDLNKVLQREPASHNAIYMRAIARRQLQRFGGAITDLLELIPVAPPLARFELYYMLGDCNEELSQFEQAETAYSNAIAADDGEFTAFVARGRVRRKTGQLQMALADLEKAAKLAPTCADVLHSRAEIYRELAEYKSARTDLESALELDAGFIEARLDLAELLLRCPDEAIRYPSQALWHLRMATSGVHDPCQRGVELLQEAQERLVSAW